MCVYFKRGGENRRIGADWWGEMAQPWGRGGTCVGLDGAAPGNEWRRKVTVFSGYGGANGLGMGEVVPPGCALGRAGGIGKAVRRRQGDGRRFRVGRGGRLLVRETVLGASSNLKQARADGSCVGLLGAPTIVIPANAGTQRRPGTRIQCHLVI